MTNPFEEKEDYTLSIILSNPTKAKINQVANSIVSSVKEKDEGYLDAFMTAKALEDIAKKITSDLKTDAKEDFEMMNLDKGSKYRGADVVVSNLADKYDFSHDETWCTLTNEIKVLSDKKKEREKLMIQAVKLSQLVDENGEVIPPAEIVEYGGATLRITLPKE